MANPVPYKEPKYKMHEVVILYNESDETYFQAEILQANTNMEGEWLYRFNRAAVDFPVHESDIIGIAK